MNESELINKLKSKINNLVESITILFENNKDEPALILFYCLIDQLSWLSCEKEFSNGTDFKAWVGKYLDVDSLNCNSEDLWNNRCALSHMGTSQSIQYKGDKHNQLVFYKNIHLTDEQLGAEQSNYPVPIKMVDIGCLSKEFNKALDMFLLDFLKDEILRNRVFEKVQKMTNTFN